MQERLRKIGYNECLRPSCYDCPAKSGKSQSDITLGDFWGIQEIHPEIDDDKGLSLVLINSEKGKKIIELLNYKIHIWRENYELAWKSNPAIEHSVDISPNRNLFVTICRNLGFKIAIDMIKLRIFMSRVKRKVWGIFKFIK